MILFEIAIGVFAGYCSCYFIADKLMSATPEEIIMRWIAIVEDELKNRKQ